MATGVLFLVVCVLITLVVLFPSTRYTHGVWVQHSGKQRAYVDGFDGGTQLTEYALKAPGTTVFCLIKAGPPECFESNDPFDPNSEDVQKLVLSPIRDK